MPLTRCSLSLPYLNTHFFILVPTYTIHLSMLNIRIIIIQNGEWQIGLIEDYNSNVSHIIIIYDIVDNENTSMHSNQKQGLNFTFLETFYQWCYKLLNTFCHQIASISLLLDLKKLCCLCWLRV